MAPLASTAGVPGELGELSSPSARESAARPVSSLAASLSISLLVLLLATLGRRAGRRAGSSGGVSMDVVVAGCTPRCLGGGSELPLQPIAPPPPPSHRLGLLQAAGILYGTEVVWGIFGLGRLLDETCPLPHLGNRRCLCAASSLS